MGLGRVTSRQLWVAIESIHAVTYFAAQCRQALRDAGVKGFWAGYFAARAAPLGVVGAGPVVAAFYNFHPAMVQQAVPSCWEVIDPGELTVRRAAAAVAGLIDLCAPGQLAGAVAALPLLRAVSERSAGEGRVMAGANRGLWPSVAVGLGRRGVPAQQVAVAEVWQACTSLREHRGDGHVAALLTHGISGLDAHLLAAGTQGLPAEVLRDNRGWSDQQWQAGAADMTKRGLLHPDGSATVAGRAVHSAVESLTDDLAERALAALDDREVDRLHRALSGCATDIQSSGLLPFPNPMGLPEL